MQRQPLLSLDTLIAFPFFGVFIALYRDPRGVILSALLIIYLIIDLFWPWSALVNRANARRRVFLTKLTLICLAISFVTLIPTGQLIAERLRTGSPALLSDSMAQIEVGLNFLRGGLNPYAQDYSNTLMAQVPFELSGITQNPSLHHFAYLPLFLEFSFPVYFVFGNLAGWWDQRLLYLAMLLVSLGALLQSTKEPDRKLILVVLLGLNPMLVPAFLAGMNEIFPLMWLTLSAVFLQRGRTLLGWCLFALAVASKQTAWLFVPFAIANFFFSVRPVRKEAFQTVLKQIAPGVLLLALSVVPFLLWEPRAFIEDTFGFLVGATAEPSVIAGIGLGGLLLSLGVIQDALANYPFVVWQAAIGGPLLIALLFHQSRHRHLRYIWIYGACFGIVLTFLSRVFADRYLGFYLVVAAVGAFADPPPEPASGLAGINP